MSKKNSKDAPPVIDSSAKQSCSKTHAIFDADVEHYESMPLSLDMDPS